MDDRLMALTTRDDLVRGQLFRFVDVLPSLRTPAQVSGHLREYLAGASTHLPSIARAAVGLLPQNGWMSRGIAALARMNASRMARRFIAATDVDQAASAVLGMRRQNLAFTIDVLGEAVVSEAEAEIYQRRYLDLLEGLSRKLADSPPEDLLDRDDRGPIPRANVSIKLSSLYSQFDPIDPDHTSASVRARLRPVLRLARKLGAFVNLDMEQFAYKDLTIRIFKETLTEEEFVDWTDVGIAIQAYLRSTGEDLISLAEWAQRRGTPVWVRLVKGAYWDFETITAAQNGWPTPVFTQKAETDANFEAQTTFLLEHHNWLRPAVASHNIRSIAHALAEMERLSVPMRSAEFQMLFGMADPIKTALAEMGHRVRVYTPFGELLPGMAYLVRRLLENTSNESFLRAGFVEHVPEEKLLMNPLRQIRQKQAPSRSPGVNGKLSDFQNEPPTDFSRDEARAAMKDALERMQKTLGQRHPLVIGGRRMETTRWIDSINPSHKREIVGRAVSATTEHAEQAVAAAKKAFVQWRNESAATRADLLLRVADVLRRERFELAAVEVYESGKPWREADADVAEAIDFCEYYAREALRLHQPWRRDVPGETNQRFYEPRGVAVVIAPWNFPLAILCGMTAAAVVTGNTVVMKPAEQSPVIAARLMRAFEEAGAPAGVVNYLPGVGEEIGPVLVSHPDVSVIAFTGSRAVGLDITAKASLTPPGQDHIKRIITELGGKNAIIIDEDADLDEAVHGVVASAFGYAGQKCSACSRAIVLAPAYETFIARLIEATKSLKVLPAEDPGCVVGPVIDAEAQERILKRIEDGKHEARLVYAGDADALKEEGFYIAPHVFADVPPSSSLGREEIFGPVLSVIKAADLAEALEIANGTAYALTGGIYSRSPANVDRTRREFRVGNLYVNRKITGALVGRQPFGGFKLSGVGSQAGGPDYLLQFVLPRIVTENTLRHGFAPPADDPPAGE